MLRWNFEVSYFDSFSLQKAISLKIKFPTINPKILWISCHHIMGGSYDQRLSDERGSCMNKLSFFCVCILDVKCEDSKASERKLAVLFLRGSAIWTSTLYLVLVIIIWPLFFFLHAINKFYTWYIINLQLVK